MNQATALLYKKVMEKILLEGTSITWRRWLVPVSKDLPKANFSWVTWSSPSKCFMGHRGHCILSKSMLDSKLSGAVEMLEADIPKDLARLENGLLGTSGSSAKSRPWDSRSLQWYRLGPGCLEHNSAEHRCGRQGAAEGSAMSSSSTASSPSAVPVGSGKGLVLLYSLFLSPQLKRSASSGIPSTERHWPTQTSLVEGHNIKAVIKGWSTGCTREEKAKEAPCRCAGMSEGLFREVPGGKRGANRVKSAQEILS